MKKLITLLLFVLFVSVNAYSQTAERKYEYAIVNINYVRDEIYIWRGTDAEKVTENYFETKNIKMDKKKFYSYVVDALNYMNEFGYEFCSASNDDNGGSRIGEHYLLKREIKK